MSSARYVGGPFDGGCNPDAFIDEIEMRTPAGCGKYVRGRDDRGIEVYRWESAESVEGPPVRN